MLNVTFLTTDLPYFPGKSGVDFHQLRHLSATHHVSVVSVQHPHYPAEGVENLRRTAQSVRTWPHAVPPSPLLAGLKPGGHRGLAGWVGRLPESWRLGWLERLLGLRGQTSDAFLVLATFTNFAPHLLASWREHRPQVLILIQSNTASWLDYLPATPARLVYFHDVRTQSVRLKAEVEGGDPDAWRKAWQQEMRFGREADVIAFVSELDAVRGRELLALHPPLPLGNAEGRSGPLPHEGAEPAVAPIPVDHVYFHPRDPARPRPEQPRILFTGHLSYGPNVDAVRYFLAEIWPLVLAQAPEAVFQVVGLLPSDEVRALCATHRQVELHANVPDIRPYFWDASAYVVPMRHGGGVRQKIFESWACGLPVVSTTMGAEGTGGGHARELWLEDTPERFAGRLAEVLRAGPGGIPAAALALVEARQTIPRAGASFQAAVERAFALRCRRPRKVLLDLRWLQPGSTPEVFELVDAMVRLAPQWQFTLLCSRSVFHEWNFAGLRHVRGLHFDPLERRLEALRARLVNSLAVALGRQEILTPEMRTLAFWKRVDFDLVHAWRCPEPDLAAFPCVLTLPESPTGRSEEEAAGRAEQVICSSEAARQDLHSRLSLPLAKLTALPAAGPRLRALQTLRVYQRAFDGMFPPP